MITSLWREYLSVKIQALGWAAYADNNEFSNGLTTPNNGTARQFR